MYLPSLVTKLIRPLLAFRPYWRANASVSEWSLIGQVQQMAGKLSSERVLHGILYTN